MIGVRNNVKTCQNSTCSAKSSGSAGSSRRGSMARSASCAARALRATPPGSSSAAAAVLGAASNACLGSCEIRQRSCFNALHAGLQLVSLQAHAQATTRFAGHRELAWQRILNCPAPRLPNSCIKSWRRACIRSSEKSGTGCCLRSSRPLPPAAGRSAVSMASRLGPWPLALPAACRFIDLSSELPARAVT